jgi:hypothetical protein
MTPTLENPDRNFSASGDAEGLDGLRRALPTAEPAMPYNEVAKRRIGKVIADAILPACLRRPPRHVGTKRTSRFG